VPTTPSSFPPSVPRSAASSRFVLQTSRRLASPSLDASELRILAGSSRKLRNVATPSGRAASARATVSGVPVYGERYATLAR